jgi:hypothetical protein
VSRSAVVNDTRNSCVALVCRHVHATSSLGCHVFRRADRLRGMDHPLSHTYACAPSHAHVRNQGDNSLRLNRRVLRFRPAAVFTAFPRTDRRTAVVDIRVLSSPSGACDCSCTRRNSSRHESYQSIGRQTRLYDDYMTIHGAPIPKLVVEHSGSPAAVGVVR